MDLTKLSNEELLQLKQKQGGVGGQQQINPALLQQQRPGAAKLIGDFMTRLGGGKPEDNESDLTKFYNQELIKKQLGRSPYDDLIEKAKAIEAAKSTGNRTLFDSLVGESTPTTQRNIPAQPTPGSGMVAPEIDPFTGKPSTLGVQQEFGNKLIEQQGIQDIKAKSPTAKQKDDLANIKNVETLLGNMENDAKSVPSGYSGISSQVRGFMTRGEEETNTVVYNDQRKAVAVALYRALTGDTRLSDADAAARALPLLWKPDEASEVRTLKFQRLKKLLNDRKSAVSANIGGVEEANEIDTELDANVNAMLDQLGA